MADFDPRHVPGTFYLARIAQLEGRLAQERAAVIKTEAELEWWQQGYTLFAENDEVDRAPDAEAAPDDDGVVQSADPVGSYSEAPAPRDQGVNEVSSEPAPEPATANSSSDSTTRPVLRQAVLRVLVDHRAPMRAGDIISELGRRGWLPDGKYGEHAVRTRLRDLVKNGQVRKVAYATYQASPNARPLIAQDGSSL